MSEQSFNQPLEDEISLKDIIDFLMKSWKTILGVGLLGLLGSLGFLAVTPNQYQATAQIQMAQINSTGDIINSRSPTGINVEPPSLLIARLSLPSSHSEKVIKACGLENEQEPSEHLVAMSNFSLIKGIDSAIELKVRMKSKEGAANCALSLFESIKESQNQIIKPYIEEAKSLLVKHQDRLKEAQSLILRADKSGPALSAAYLGNRDEIKFLTDESIRLNSFIVSADTRQAKLISPIYVLTGPVFPNKNMILVIGPLLGIFLSFLIIIIHRSLNNPFAHRQ